LLEALQVAKEFVSASYLDHDENTPNSKTIFEGLETIHAAIAKAKGKAASLTDNREQLPPDPEKKNGDRAEWAAAALRHFQYATGCDYEDSLGDLLCDLMRWADRNNFDFEAGLCRAWISSC
jgi:hypothetical protein